MPTAPPTPAERFAALVAWLSQAVAMHTGWDQRMSLTLIADIIARLRGIKWAVLRIAARVQAGSYHRRAFAPRPRTAGVRRIDPLPKQRNWLEPMLAEVVPCRGYLLDLLHDPEMVALIQAAPEAMGRPLRSLCRMLGLRPPPILAIRNISRAAPSAAPPAPASRQAPAAKPPAPPPPFQAAPAPAIVPVRTQRKSD